MPAALTRLQNGHGLYSQAGNFLGRVSTGVDPRTGQFTLALALPIGVANDLAGPSISASLSFNALGSAIDTGLGRGWSLSLSELNLASGSLRLSTGESFSVDMDRSDFSEGAELLFFDRKLESFRVVMHGANGDRFRVEYKSGDIEILQVQERTAIAVPVEVRSPEGRCVFLDWLPSGSDSHWLLYQIRDEQRPLLRITPEGQEILLQSNPDHAIAASTIRLSMAGERLSQVTLADPAQSQWLFDYTQIDGLLFPERVSGPLGSVDTVLYASGANGHRLPPGAPLANLPRVVSWVHDPGAEQLALYRIYRWTGEHNFLGYGAALPGGWRDGQDNLYQVASNYRYGVTESLFDQAGEALSSTERSWNRFHLQTEECTTRQGVVVRVITEYDEDPRLPWEQQHAWCQLPWKITTEYGYGFEPGQKAALSRRESTETRYDSAGNILYFRDITGVTELRDYYPASGGCGCPPDPLGFVRWTRQYSVIPAPAADGASGGAATLATTYQYSLLPSLIDNAPAHVVLAREDISQVTTNGLTALGSTVQTFIDRPHSPWELSHYGRPKTSISTLNDIPTTTLYDYELSNDQLTVQTTVSGHEDNDENRVIRRHTRSVFDGLTVKEQDEDGVIQTYEHDVLGRIVRKVVAVGTDSEVTMTCRYQLRGKQRDQQVYAEETDAMGVRKRQYLDGDGRTLRTEVEDVDNTPVIFRAISSSRYDALGQVERQTLVDWLPDTLTALSVTTRYAYDGWGNLSAARHADGTVEHSLYDPVTRLAKQWLQSKDGCRTGSTQTQLNAFGSPCRVEQLDLQEQVVLTQDLLRDGLDRVVQRSDTVPGQAPIITQTCHDLHGRVSSQTLPDGTIIRQTYAAHSDDEHVQSIKVTDSEGTCVIVGTQEFDGLGRQSSVEVGGRIHTLQYAAGQVPPVSQITARNDLISYTYDKTLDNLLTSVTQGADVSRFSYDRRHAQVQTATGGLGEQTTTYSRSGKPQTQTWKVGEQQHTLCWRYSLSGRLVSFVDASGDRTTLDYDLFGRLKRESTDALSVTFEYDGFSRPCRIVTQDRVEGRTLAQNLTYDAFGRESSRQITTAGDGMPVQRYTQTLTYSPLNQVKTRRWEDGQQLLSEELYRYDSRGRLTVYDVTGPNAPADAFGNVLRQQRFDFNALDGYRQVHSEFADGTCDQAIFTYNQRDPTQLRRVTHSHPSWPPLLEPEYDAHGNVTADGSGRQLNWDTQNRLVSITEGARTCHYRYNPMGQTAEVELDGRTLRRFYQGDQIVNERDGDSWIRYMSQGLSVFAQSRLSLAVRSANGADDHQLAPPRSMLLGNDAQGSIRMEVDESVRIASFTPYGVPSGDPMDSQPGFAGQWQDPLTGWSMPGSYRPYDPVLMCFLSPDSESPFGEGGLNPYSYCAGDPVNNIDPDGHAWWKWLVAGVGTALAVVGTVASLGVAAPAIAALWAGGMGVGGALAITSAGLSAVSLATGIAAMTLEATGGDEKAASILGWVSLGTGIASAVTGLGAAQAAKAAGKSAQPSSGTPGRWSRRIDSFNSKSEGRLIYQKKPGNHDVYFHQNLFGQGITAWEAHGSVFGRLMNANGKMQNATKVALREIAPALKAAAVPDDKPVMLLACWGGRSGAAQQVANALKRPVVGFDYSITVSRPMFMTNLRVPAGMPVSQSNLITAVRTNPFARLSDFLRGVPGEQLAAMHTYFPR